MSRFARPTCEALEGRILLNAHLPGVVSGEGMFLVGELNGDGVDDLILARPDINQVWIDSGGTGWRVLGGGAEGMRTPVRLSLADLTGDGLADLIVCNRSGSVLVFPGEEEGGFASEVYDGWGSATGAEFAGVAVGYLLDGAPLPGLVLTQEETDEVLILTGKGTGESWSMHLAQRLRADAGPVAVTLGDVTGDGVVDLVVTCRKDNRVRVLPGIGGGLFDGADPWSLETGDQPLRSLLADFDGDGRLDLVSIDSGSSTLTLFRDVALAGPGQALSSGGLGPVDALARDVNGDGASDLIVANQQDQAVTLFLGGSGGLQLAQTLTPVGLRPAALAASATDPDPWSFYAAGIDATVVRLSFTPTIVPTETSPLDEMPRTHAEDDLPLVINLEPIGPASVDVLPVVLTSEPFDAVTPAAEESRPAPVLTGRLPRDLTGGSAPEPEAVAPERPRPEAVAPVPVEGGRLLYLLNVDAVLAPAIGPDGAARSEEEMLMPSVAPAIPEPMPRENPVPERVTRVVPTSALAPESERPAEQQNRAEAETERVPAGLSGRDEVFVQAVWALAGLGIVCLWPRESGGTSRPRPTSLLPHPRRGA